MTDNIESLLLARFRKLDEGQDKILAELHEIKHRLSRLEIDVANAHVERAEDRSRYDRLDERIERRLELRDEQ